MNSTTGKIKERVEAIQLAIDEAAKKNGRSAKDITLVAVTKGATPEAILEARAAGVMFFGENKVQEAETKIAVVNDPSVQWHMVGHLQTNKIKTALSLFSLIQSVDSVRLAKMISDESILNNKVTAVLLEVNISGEVQRFGFSAEEIYTAIESMSEMPGIRIMGLMGIAPVKVAPEVVRAAFKKLRNIFSVCKGVKQDNLEMKYLSMGMSDDYKIAIEEGANMIRLGRALFK